MIIPKPAPGTAAKMKRARRRLVDVRERAAKDAAKARDAYFCRRCRTYWDIEAAHLVSSGMGGRPSVGSKRSDFLTLCRMCHQGPRSVHSGHVRIVAGPEGGDGPVSFLELSAAQVGRI